MQLLCTYVIRNEKYAMKSMNSYLAAHANGEMINKMTTLNTFDAKRDNGKSFPSQSWQGKTEEEGCSGNRDRGINNSKSLEGAVKNYPVTTLVGQCARIHRGTSISLFNGLDESRTTTCHLPNGHPHRRSDLTLCDFFLWEYAKDRVFVPHLPVDLADLKQYTTITIVGFDSNTLTRAMEVEMDYRLNVYRVTKGSHIEHV
ncbi:hypothetical protein TNCV_1860071 [Trichonephila clavipes]|nr:hypothetical protein TNCV_1860071 [Trichonephila clavipes]